jgi:hypothetical protein
MRFLLASLLSVLSTQSAIIIWDADTNTPPANIVGYNVYCVTNNQPTTVVAITGRSGGVIRNDATKAMLGFKFVMSSDATITHLGRWVLEGNSRTHTLQLLTASTQVLASVIVDMAGKTPGQFEYVPLPAPVLIASGQEYFLMSSEPMGGDAWYSFDQTLTVHPLISYIHSAYDGQLASNTGKSYGPVSFLATVSQIPALSEWSLLKFTEGTSLTLSNLLADVKYLFYVNSVDFLWQTSAPSAIVSYSLTKPLPPLPPINLNTLTIAKRQGNTWFNISVWFDPIDLPTFGAESYQIKAQPNSGSPIIITALTSPAIFPSLTVQDYVFSAWVTNRDGTSPIGRQIGIVAKNPGSPINVQIIQ